MQRFGNYIVYVDESGDHSLSQINSDYPRFVLAFCIFPVADYVETVAPAVQRLKFQHFGHDMIVFHEHEIRKEEFKSRRGGQTNPYDVALEFGLERVFLYLQGKGKGQLGRRTRVVFEGRGRKEDAALELAFRRIMDTTRISGMADTLEFLCAHKQANSSGLQIADMIARPIGIHDLRPDQPNHAWNLIEPKIRRDPRSGRINGWGLKVYP